MNDVNPATANSFMNENKRYPIWVALTVALGGCLLGFVATGIAGTGADQRLGWGVFTSCGFPILATPAFVVYGLRNQQQTVVILERLCRPLRRLTVAGAKE